MWDPAWSCLRSWPAVSEALAWAWVSRSEYPWLFLHQGQCCGWASLVLLITLTGSTSAKNHQGTLRNNFFFVFCLFRAALMACGGSQARGPIGAIAAGLHRSHSNAGSDCVCDVHHSSRQHRILNPLREARDRTHNLMVPCRICFRCTTTGTPLRNYLYYFRSWGVHSTSEGHAVRLWERR